MEEISEEKINEILLNFDKNGFVYEILSMLLQEIKKKGNDLDERRRKRRIEKTK